jgi:hypothetical protein
MPAASDLAAADPLLEVHQLLLHGLLLADESATALLKDVPSLKELFSEGSHSAGGTSDGSFIGEEGLQALQQVQQQVGADPAAG